MENIDTIMQRLDEIEDNFNKRLDSIDKKLKTLEKKPIQQMNNINGGTSKDKKSKDKKSKDKNAPKRPKSAYIFFCQDKRDEMIKKYPNENPIGGISKKLGEEWKTLNVVQKAKYTKMANNDKKRYESEMNNYQNDNESD